MRDVVKDRKALFNEPIAATDALRQRQARELGAYVDAVAGAGAAAFAADYASAEAYERSVAPLREHLARAVGYPPPVVGELPAAGAVVERIGEDVLCTYDRVTVEALPGVHAVGLLLLPKGAAGPHPLVVAQHGGAGSPEVATFFGGENYNDMVRGAVAEGYAVFAPLHLHDREEMPRQVRQTTDLRLRQVGTTIVAVEVFKLKRSLDVLCARGDIAGDRVGYIGLSYGGMYAVLAAALEPRIKAAVASCYAVMNQSNLKDPISMLDRHWMTSATLLRNGNLAALVCPRPLQIQHGLGDTIIPAVISRDMAAGVRGHYEALGLLDRFEHVEFDGWHEFRGNVVWPFLRKWL